MKCTSHKAIHKSNAARTVRSIAGLCAVLCCFPCDKAAYSQGMDGMRVDRKDLVALKGFAPGATDFYNQKAEKFWYKGSSEFTTGRFFYGFSEVNYAVLRFPTRQAVTTWDARFARIGVRSGWCAGNIFRNAESLKPKVVSELPDLNGLIALHLDFSVGNTVILVGGNQHKSQFHVKPMDRNSNKSSVPKGLADMQLKRTVQDVAEDLKRRVSVSEPRK